MSTKDNDASDGGFLKRWSQRKQTQQPAQAEHHDQLIDDTSSSTDLEPTHDQLTEAASQSLGSADADLAIAPEALADTPIVVDDAVVDDSVVDDLGQPSETVEELTDADMPDIESIDGSSDISGFMSPGVSEALRKRALRKVFASVVFNVRDGLDDYDDDFTNFEALGDMVTSDMKHREERLRAEQEELAREQEESIVEQDGVDDETQADDDSSDDGSADDAATSGQRGNAENEGAADHTESAHPDNAEKDSPGDTVANDEDAAQKKPKSTSAKQDDRQD